jgi:hypothetical protein
MTQPPTHPTLTFALDVADKLIKLAAVLIGALWTWWNYRKSRTYEQKLELEVLGTVFAREDLYGDIKIVVKNIGATKHSVQQAGTFCRLSTVHNDLTERQVRVFPVFTQNNKIEPGEAMIDTLYWRIAQPFDDIIWVKLTLRVVSSGVEWNSSAVIRLEVPGVAASNL